ncbi:hypothetical protein EMIHUDRAFT_211495 [Emiliania huxleyi CCMP1516]|uniref:G domain-containing protein n=2 Tax=Emiliania huxleyi TaxID=2903 RepID=A0A0D3IVQ2_EMIH1|nr:hypothetical protein EMIHUDRAFT_211495 [Emiliania huxleyi CCMP1516]EOD15337.1 hypothetical protein EMIHUDRAFT_211495 [Emiliania huxleyi CCMP1516]|eukprot:XP_005767766.1 hypothetical protein EMIHUDRAFT_211495 [Emiliania huxleyi CCMP1516]
MPPPPRLATITPPTAELLDALPISDGPVETPRDARALRACLVGPTNAGKSTLLNALIDSRVSIVSDKIHTTRENTLGYLTDTAAATQIEFVDAPGSLGPSVPIIRRAITEALSSADLALTALVLNKVDLVRPKTKLLRVSEALSSTGLHSFDWPGFMLSAQTGDGVRDLRRWLLTMARPGPWRVSAGVSHVQPPLVIASEVIRSHIFRCFRKELPYTLMQQNLGWTEMRNGGVRIDQQLLLPPKNGIGGPAKASTRAIVERRLPMVGKGAGIELSEVLGRPVSLVLSIGTQGPAETMGL